MRNNKKIVAIIASLTFSVVFSILFKWVQTGNPLKQETIMFGISIFSLLLINGYLGYVILNKMSNKASAEIKKQIIPSFLLFTLLTLITSLIVVSIIIYVYFLTRGYDTSGFINHLFTVELKSAVKQFGIWILLASSFFFYMIWRKAIEREQKLKEENLRFKYQNLKNQINPHFLFNTLNTLSELVYMDAKKSDDFIHNLSSTYRYVIKNEEVDLVELDKEIAFVKQYFSLQQARDGQKVKLEIDIAHTTGIKVVPVSLQILVENALKHNAKSEEKPLIIKIKEKNGELIVSNPIQKKSILENSTKTGLSNLKSRTKIITGKELVVNEDNNIFTVKLPTSQ
jgi:sensor histidine kinase YesM